MSKRGHVATTSNLVSLIAQDNTVEPLKKSFTATTWGVDNKGTCLDVGSNPTTKRHLMLQRGQLADVTTPLILIAQGNTVEVVT